VQKFFAKIPQLNEPKKWILVNKIVKKVRIFCFLGMIVVIFDSNIFFKTPVYSIILLLKLITPSLEVLLRALKVKIMQKALQTDATLVSSYIKGQEFALEILIHRHKQKVYSFIYSKVFDKDIAEDIFQDTFIKVINTLKRGAYNEEGKFLPWVMRIAHNLVIDHFRKNNRMPKFDNSGEFSIFSVLSDSALNAEKTIIKSQVENDVKRLIDELPGDQKEVLIMRIYNDMSFKEISERTGVSINTALGRMRYALINLRKIIDKHNIILTN